MVFQAVDLGVVSCVRDRFLDDLYAYELISFAAFQETYPDASGPAVEIENHPLDMSDHVHGLAEKLLGSERIGLEEGERRDPETDFRR